MTHLSIRFKSFYVITSFLFIVFLFSPLKTFANVETHTLNAEDSTFKINNVVKEDDTRKIYSKIITNANTTQTKVKPLGFYQENSTKWVSKVFKGGVPLDSVSHTVYWNGTGSMSTSPAFQMTSNDPDTSKLLRLEVSSDITLKGIPDETVSKDIFFKNGKNGDGTTNIGFITPSTGNLNARTYSSPYYNVKVFKVFAPFISSFTATSTTSGMMREVSPATDPKVYTLIAGNSFTLNWQVASATATTACTLSDGDTVLKTFDNTDIDKANDFSLGTNNVVTFTHTISSHLTAGTRTTYHVSCSHNGVGTPATKSMIVNVVPVASITTFTANGIPGGTTTGKESITVDYQGNVDMVWHGDGETCTGSSVRSEGGGVGEWSTPRCRVTTDTAVRRYVNNYQKFYFLLDNIRRKYILVSK